MSWNTAVVTGAAGGIGRALAIRLAATGTRLVLADLHAAPLRHVASELGGTAVPTDVSDPDAVLALAQASPDADLLCLNAGVVGSLGAPWEISPVDWNAVFAVNVGGVLNGLRAFVPRMLASRSPAHILITASLAGLASFPGSGAYGPSKHTVLAIAEQAAFALQGEPVGVTVLCPALVRSGMSDIGQDPLEVADQALAAIGQGRFVVMPDDWRGAITRRAQQLATGDRPSAPLPDRAVERSESGG